MDNHYKVSWRFRTSRHDVVRDFQSPDLKTLLRTLAKSEGVRPDGVAELIIHKINGDGTVAEIFVAADGDKLSKDAEHRAEFDRLLAKGRSQENEDVTDRVLLDTTAAIIKNRNPSAKPRIKLKATDDLSKVYDPSGLWFARSASG